MPSLSIVILALYREDEFLTSIKNLFNDPIIKNSEFIIVDQTDHDKFVKAAEKYRPVKIHELNSLKNGLIPNIDTKHIHVIKTHENLGLEGWNIGCRSATGDILFILDEDSYPLTGSTENALNHFVHDPKLGIVAPQVLNPGDQLQWPRYIKNNSEVVGFTGNAWFIRRQLFKDIEYYPHEYFMFYNEISIAPLIIKKGFKIIYFEDVKTFHAAAPKKRLDTWRIYYFTRNYFWTVLRFDPIYLLPLTFTYGLCDFTIKSFLYKVDKKRFLKALYEGIFKRPKRLTRNVVYSKKHLQHSIEILIRSSIGFLTRK